MKTYRLMGALVVAAVCCQAPLAADEMDEANGDPPGTHQGRVDNIIEMLDNDADPNVVVPQIFDYVDYYIDIGYQRLGIDHYGAVTRAPGVFGEAYEGWERRLRLRIRDLLRRCDPRGFKEALDYIEFYEEGYGEVITLTPQEKVEQSEEFGAAYKRWKWRDQARQRLRDGDGGEAEVVEAVGDLLGTLRDEDADPAARLEAAGRLGTISAGDVEMRLLRQLLGDEDSLARYWAAALLVRLGPAALEAEEELLAGLEDESWPLRHVCAAVLSSAGQRAGDEVMDELLDQQEEEVDRWPGWPQKEGR